MLINSVEVFDTQIMGSIVKYVLAKSLNVEPSNIYHVAIMPCYDKKLEASREEFYDDLLKSRDVDCVLATTEVLQIIEQDQPDFGTLEVPTLTPAEFSNIDSEGRLFGAEGGTSGAFLEFIYQYAAKELFNIDNPTIEYVKGRNNDFVEVTLKVYPGFTRCPIVFLMPRMKILCCCDLLAPTDSATSKMWSAPSKRTRPTIMILWR